MSTRFPAYIGAITLGLLTAVGCAAEEQVPGGDTTPNGGAGGKAGAGTGGGGASAAGSGTTAGTSSTGGSVNPLGGSSSGGTGTAGSGTGGSTTGGSSAAGSGTLGGTGPVNTGLPYMENFESGTANGFIPWSEDFPNGTTPGNWGVVADGAGMVIQPMSTVDELEFVVGGSSSWTDVKLTVKVRIAAESRAQIAVRFTPPKTYYFVEMAEGTFKLRQRTDGSTTDLIAPSGDAKPTIVAGTWYTVAVEIKGTSATLTLDGAPIGTATGGADPPKGGIALGVTEGSVSYDDVLVEAAL